jgi:hypothetical protein
MSQRPDLLPKFQGQNRARFPGLFGQGCLVLCAWQCGNLQNAQENVPGPVRLVPGLAVCPIEALVWEGLLADVKFLP